MSININGSGTKKRENVSPEEDLALSRSWISASTTVLDEDCESFWKKCGVVFGDQPETDKPQLSGILHGRWGTSSRIMQKYLAAEKRYQSSIPSGETEKDTLDSVMHLYRQKNAQNLKKNTVPVSTISSMAVVHRLSLHPKFSAHVSGSSRDTSRYRPERRYLDDSDVAGEKPKETSGKISLCCLDF